MSSRAAKHSSLSPEHFTPAWLVDAVRDAVGPFDLDPASCGAAQAVVRAGRYFSLRERGEDGLALPWRSPGGEPQRIICNPPGDPRGKLVPAFWRRCLGAAAAGDVVAWIGFSMEQLAVLADACPLWWPTVVLRRRVCFDTLARPGRTTSLWAEAAEAVHNLPRNERKHVAGALVDEWIRGPVERVPGRSPTHHNYVTLLGADEPTVAAFRERMREFGAFVSGSPENAPKATLNARARDQDL